ncbi:hypothetical protein AAMO2058_001411400 [Amorphochlora amoebiformis]
MMPYSCALLQGSGIIVDKEGLLVTNRHVTGEKYKLQGADIKLFVQTSNGQVYRATVVNKHPVVDLALLNLTHVVNEGIGRGEEKMKLLSHSNFPELTPIDFSNGSATAVGDLVMAVGDNFGLANSITMGVISAFREDPTGVFNPRSHAVEGKLSEDQGGPSLDGELTMPDSNLNRKPFMLMSEALDSAEVSGVPVVLQHDASINHGNSGGALVNVKGELVGLNTMKIEGDKEQRASGLGFAIPARYIKELIKLARHKQDNSQMTLNGYLRQLFETMYGSKKSSIPKLNAPNVPDSPPAPPTKETSPMTPVDTDTASATTGAASATTGAASATTGAASATTGAASATTGAASATTGAATATTGAATATTGISPGITAATTATTATTSVASTKTSKSAASTTTTKSAASTAVSKGATTATYGGSTATPGSTTAKARAAKSGSVKSGVSTGTADSGVSTGTADSRGSPFAFLQVPSFE